MSRARDNYIMDDVFSEGPTVTAFTIPRIQPCPDICGRSPGYDPTWLWLHAPWLGGKMVVFSTSYRKRPLFLEYGPSTGMTARQPGREAGR